MPLQEPQEGRYFKKLYIKNVVKQQTIMVNTIIKNCCADIKSKVDYKLKIYKNARENSHKHAKTCQTLFSTKQGENKVKTG